MSTQVTTGSFVATANTPFFIPLEQYVSAFVLTNETKIASVTSGRITNASWNQYLTNGIADVDAITNFATTPAVNGAVIRSRLAQNGISIYNAANPQTYSPVAIQSFTPDPTTVWGATGHGYQVGDTVRVYGLTSAPQFSGLAMTVTAVTTNTFTTLLNSTGATTSVGSVIKIGSAYLPSKSLYYPENRVIAAMTNANPMVITTLVQQNYYVGDVVTFDIPSIFGVPQLSSQIRGYPIQATVIAANNAVGTQTVTLAVNSTNFGVFATSSGSASNSGNWPLASGYPFTFPTMVPQGEGNINNWQAFGVIPAPLPYANQDVLSFARQNQGYNGILIGAGDGTAAATTGGIIKDADTFTWICYTALQSFPQPVAQFYV